MARSGKWEAGSKKRRQCLSPKDAAAARGGGTGIFPGREGERCRFVQVSCGEAASRDPPAGPELWRLGPGGSEWAPGWAGSARRLGSPPPASGRPPMGFTKAWKQARAPLLCDCLPLSDPAQGCPVDSGS